MPDHEITLKWGTLKAWELDESDKEVIALMEKYLKIGASLSCAMHRDTDEQKQIILELIRVPNMKIYLDWDGKYVSPDEAVKYIENYGK